MTPPLPLPSCVASASDRGANPRAARPQPPSPRPSHRCRRGARRRAKPRRRRRRQGFFSPPLDGVRRGMAMSSGGGALAWGAAARWRGRRRWSSTRRSAWSYYPRRGWFSDLDRRDRSLLATGGVVAAGGTSSSRHGGRLPRAMMLAAGWPALHPAGTWGLAARSLVRPRSRVHRGSPV